MEKVIIEKYVSFDNREFESKELCELYEKNYLTDKQLEDCFHFFHKKHENYGDLDNATRPSDATHYKFKIERNEKEQTIKLYTEFRTFPSKKLCSSYTNLGLIIKHNQDFKVIYYDGECTFNIKKFYAFLEKIKNNS